MTEYSLRAMKVGEAKAPGPVLVYMSNWDELDFGPHFMYLAQGGGKTVLIQTGLPQDPEDMEILNAACRAAHPENYFRPERTRTPQQLLAEVGLTPEDVDAVLIISIGAYATGNMELFPNAEFYMSRTGWIDFMAPERPPAYAREVIFTDATLSYLVTEAWDRVHLVGDEQEVLPGIKMIWVGCHHRGSMAVVIETARGKVAISDSIARHENIDPGIPLGVLENIFECQDALDRLRKEADIIIPKHDNQVLEQYPDGVIA
jgi:glyoxylase-like metal-dependent hydrolase (beta-lactamase superfamily II)